MTTTPVYFEDVQGGMEIPPFGRGKVEMPDIVRFSSSVENFERLHHDYKWCMEHNYPDVLINGPIKQAMIATMLTNWIGESGFLKKLGCQHRGMDVPGNTLTAKGRVVKTYEKQDLGYVDLEVWVENQKGEVTCPGTATVILPKREGQHVPTAFDPPPGFEKFLGTSR